MCVENPDWMNYVSEYDEAALKEAEERYIEENFPLCAGFKDYNSTPKCAKTLDEFLMLLVKGYINTNIRSDLEKHLMELLEDDWFYQWTLVHWTYASRLLRGKGCRKSVKRAVAMLLPMAEKGYPGAMYDIGYCYMEGLRLEQSYAKAIYYWTNASNKGYCEAQRALKSEYRDAQYGQYKHDKYKELPVELKLDFILEITNLFIKDRGGYENFTYDELNESDRNRYKKLCNEAKQLKKKVEKRAPLLHSSQLFWDDEENPYKI